jgi:hypothetical protein
VKNQNPNPTPFPAHGIILFKVNLGAVKKNNLVMHIDIVAKLVGERAVKILAKTINLTLFFSKLPHCHPAI